MTAPEHFVVGVDVGTSVAKAAVLDGAGAVLRVSSRPVALQRPASGRVEQDVEEVLAAVQDVVAEAVVDLPSAPVLLALTAQGDGCWLTDEAGAPVRPAISWLDARATTLLDGWAERGVTEEAFRRTGSAWFPGAQAPLLAWLDEHEPEVLDRAATAGRCKDVVLARLTGVRATDATDASVPFGRPPGTEDRGHGQGTASPGCAAADYDTSTLLATGLGHRSDLLAPVCRPLPSAPLLPLPAARVGLPEGTPVVAGPYDLAACCEGAGVTEAGDGLLVLGTTLACLVPTTEPCEALGSADPAGLLLRLPEPGRWLRCMPAMVGTASLDWVLSLFGLPHEALADLLAAAGPGAGGVRALPYLAGAGERAPFVDTAARGQLTGLTTDSTPAQLVRAVCEGLAYAARDCFEAAGLRGRLVACGGGTRSRAWLQVFADVLGRPVVVPQVPEVGARGAVVSALRLLPDLTDATCRAAAAAGAWEHEAVVVDPDPGSAARYEDGYAEHVADRDEARRRWHRDRGRTPGTGGGVRP